MNCNNFTLESFKPYLRELKHSMLLISLRKAAKEQKLLGLADTLEQIVPDITNQYSTFKLDNPYIKAQTRYLHAFQVSLLNGIMENFEKLVIVDIGDSAGTHLQYIIALYAKDKDIRCLSVNLDMEAVEKIKKKGLEAVHARAENLHQYNVNPDIFLCFETLEHLMNPCNFLHELSSKTTAKYLIITVPYVKKSRVGLLHIRQNNIRNVHAENTHIFEFNPEDWKLIAKHSGWDVVKEKIYLQYPKMSFFNLTKYLWKKFDFEGFYGLVLKRDERWSSRYLDW